MTFVCPAKKLLGFSLRIYYTALAVILSSQVLVFLLFFNKSELTDAELYNSSCIYCKQIMGVNRCKYFSTNGPWSPPNALRLFVLLSSPCGVEAW